MKRKDIHDILHPESIAVVGASNNILGGASMFLGVLLNLGYEGKIYPVNLKEETVQGLKSYPSLSDIPDKVDHVIIGVPAHRTPAIIEAAVKKGVNSIHIFTSGFAEVGTKQGMELQKEIVDIARGKVRIIGPNCMGIYNPKAKIAFDFGLPAIPGNAGFLSQSGGLAVYFSFIGQYEENYCSKVISIGNSSDLKLTDFFEYLGEDEETNVVCIYIEGLDIKEGRKFINILKNTTRKKPVVIWKTGQTEAGAKAAASHTGTMAGGFQLWRALAEQYGAVLVDSLEEMHDFIKIHRMAPIPKSKKCCMVALGGGFSVTYTDYCVKGGLELPELQQDTQEKLLDHMPAIGTIRRNPIDLSGSAWYPNVVENSIKIVGQDKNIDAIIYIADLGFLAKNAERLDIDAKEITAHQVAGIASARDELNIPILCNIPGTLRDLKTEELKLDFQEKLEKYNIPAFPNIERTVWSLKRLYDYNRFLETPA